MAALSSCVGITTLPREIVQAPDGALVVRSMPCTGNAALGVRAADTRDALDPRAIRVLTWNIHKQADTGWARDLARFAAQSDVVLLQEATLSNELTSILSSSNLRFRMASSFLYEDTDIGVLTAARVAPYASCTERVVEPWLRLPKSAAISWFRLADTNRTLAIVNVHAVNFALSLDVYREQFSALVEALRAHEGPILFAGDFNTWTDGRLDVIRETAASLRLTAVTFVDDRRTLFFGHQLDHMMARGLDVVESIVVPVESSDHNPVLATFKLPAR